MAGYKRVSGDAVEYEVFARKSRVDPLHLVGSVVPHPNMCQRPQDLWQPLLAWRLQHFDPLPTFRGKATPVTYRVADSDGNCAAASVAPPSVSRAARNAVAGIPTPAACAIAPR